MINFQDFKVAFVNSKLALHNALRMDLNKDILFKTSSPGLLLDKDYPCKLISLEEEVTAESVEKLQERISLISFEIWSGLKAHNFDHFQAILAARTIHRCASAFYRTLSLTPKDYKEPRLVLEVDLGLADLNRRYNVPWEKLLKGNDSIFTHKSKTNLRNFHLSEIRNPHFFTRILSYGRHYWEFKYWLALGRIITPKITRGVILIAADNPLLAETAVYLARKGYLIRRIYIGRVQKLPLVDLQIIEYLKSITSDLFLKQLFDIIAPEAILALVDIYQEQFLEDLKNYNGEVNALINLSKTWDKNKVKAILSNNPEPALSKVSHDRNVLLVGYQHGNSREIAETGYCYECCREDSTSDIVITYNRKAADVSNKSRFRIGKAFDVGMPSIYKAKSLYHKFCTSKIDIMFVSTNLPVSSDGNIAAATWSDTQKEYYTIILIERVFTKLPYSVLIKPYPSSRGYLDRSPLRNLIDSTNNVTYDLSWFSLKYLIPKSKILITLRATSTVAWCIMSDKPLVYIDFLKHCSLLSPVRELFKEALFYFDGDSPDFFEKLREFLSQSMDKIETLWKKKAIMRSRLIREYISTDNFQPGKTASKIVQMGIAEKLAKVGTLR